MPATQAGLLEQLKGDWLDHGWSPETLDNFRMEMAAGDAGAAPTGSESTGTSAGSDQGSSEYSLASGFLGRVPQEHRAILEPYVKQWDAGVTRRFQELQSQLAPYKDYDPDQVAQAMSIMMELDQNPWSVYGTLRQALLSGEYGEDPGSAVGGPSQQQQNGVGQVDQGQLGTQQPQQQSIPPEFQQQFDQLRNAVTVLGQHVLGQNQQQTQQAEQDQLNDYLGSLHEEFGDFDDQWVLLQILNDQSYDNVDKHIGAWQGMVNSRQNQQQEVLSGLPNLLGSAGGTAPAPMTQQSVKGLSRKDTQSLVASVLEQAARQRDGN